MPTLQSPITTPPIPTVITARTTHALTGRFGGDGVGATTVNIGMYGEPISTTLPPFPTPPPPLLGEAVQSLLDSRTDEFIYE